MPWTSEDVANLIANPIYVGMGPYPKILDDDLWVESAVRAIGEEGAAAFLTRMLTVLRAALDAAQMP